MENSTEHNWRVLKSWFVFRPWERHSLVLMVGGLVYILVGYIFLVDRPQMAHDRMLALEVGLNLLSMRTWIFLFFVTGILACLSSRWPAFSITWGYILLTGLSSAWSSVYFLGYILGDAPTTNLSFGLVWGLLGFMWWTTAGLVNPRRPPEEAYADDPS